MLLLILLIACTPDPGSCPAIEDRFEPSVGPENTYSDDLFVVLCPDGRTAVEISQQGDSDDFAFLQCWEGICAEEYLQNDWWTYCVTRVEVNQWSNQFCTDCTVEFQHNTGGHILEYISINCTLDTK